MVNASRIAERPSESRRISVSGGGIIHSLWGSRTASYDSTLTTYVQSGPFVWGWGGEVGVAALGVGGVCLHRALSPLQPVVVHVRSVRQCESTLCCKLRHMMTHMSGSVCSVGTSESAEM